MKHHAPTTAQSEMKTAAYRVVLLAAAVILAATVMAVPGYYETTTLWYKTGIDKTMLQAGQYCGLTALILIYLQVVMAVRGSVLARIFGETNLIRCHRINGAMIVVAAISHVLLVLVPEGISNLPVGWKFWPEMVGAALLLIVVILTSTSHLRDRLNMSYNTWRIIHKPVGYIALLLVTVHALFVSESFEHTGPRISITVLFLLVAVMAAATKYRAARNTQTSSPE